MWTARWSEIRLLEETTIPYNDATYLMLVNKKFLFGYFITFLPWSINTNHHGGSHHKSVWYKKVFIDYKNKCSITLYRCLFVNKYKVPFHLQNYVSILLLQALITQENIVLTYCNLIISNTIWSSRMFQQFYLTNACS